MFDANELASLDANYFTVIYKDIYEMSEGRIRVDSESCPLAEFNVVQPTGKKKKKK